MPDTDVGTTTDFKADELVSATPTARFAMDTEACTFPGHGGSTPVEGRIVRGPDYQRDYLVSIEGNRYWVGEQYLVRVGDDVTMSVTAPQPCTYPEHATEAEHKHWTYNLNGTVVWSTLDYGAGSMYDSVPGTFIKVPAEPVAGHHTRPEWPLYPCTLTYHDVGAAHYHVTEGGDTFDPGGYIMHGIRVYEQGTQHTEQGRRYTSQSAFDTLHAEHWEQALDEAASRISDTLPPPEEVLRRLEAGDDVDPDVDADSAGRIQSLLDRITEARNAVDNARHTRAEWLDRLIDRSREVAEEQEWCGVYDQGMRELGLPDRDSWDRPSREEEITVNATIEVEVPFDDDDFNSWFADNVTSDFDSIDGHRTTFTVNVPISAEVTVTADECGCNDPEWGELVPSWVHNYDWTITGEDCSND